MQTIGEKIRELRKSKKISQEELAFQLGVSRQTIHKWEGSDARPGTDNLKLLCDYFKVSSDYFINESPLVTEFAAVNEATTVEKIAEVNETVAVDDVSVCNNKLRRKTKRYLIVCCVITIIVSFALICSIAFTVGIGFIVFTDNCGYEKISLLEVEKYTFNLFLTLSLILATIDLAMVFYIIKK